MSEYVRRLPPQGDSLSAMSDSQRSAWANDLRLSAGDTLEALSSPQTSITVDVKLVGFDGDGNQGLVIEDHELQAQLRTLHNQLETVALHPSPKHMSVRPSIEFRVHPAYYQLATRVNTALNQAVASSHPSTAFTDFSLSLLNPTIVSSVLEDDFVTTMAGVASYTIYLVNPKVASPYAYAYDNEHRSCPGGIYLSQKHRFAFYDLTANITFYGPGPGGKGQVLSHSVPQLSHYRPEAMRRAVLPDLAALVWSACQHLVWPPMHNGDLSFRSNVAVHIIYMHQDLLGAVSHIDRSRLEQELREAVRGVQQVSVVEHFHPFGECPHCVAGYSSAIRARTSLPHENDVQVSQYLDVQSLESWVHEWRDVVLSDVGVNVASADKDGTHVLPVLVFDSAGTEAILLDGWRQAVALPSGAAVAVRSGHQTVPTFFGCHDKQVYIDPQELHRPVMAAVLQAGWGVADTALFWSEATGRSWSFLWSLGPTPFGPLSTLGGLSFAQRDAMLRNLALAQINGSLSHVQALMRGFVSIGGPDAQVKTLLAPDQVIPYHQRISLLLFKLQEAMAALGRLDHAAAIGYAASMMHDAGALHTIVRRTRKNLAVELHCLGAKERARWWLLPGGAGVVCLLLVVWRALRGGGGSEKKHMY